MKNYKGIIKGRVNGHIIAYDPYINSLLPNCYIRNAEKVAFELNRDERNSHLTVVEIQELYSFKVIMINKRTLRTDKIFEYVVPPLDPTESDWNNYEIKTVAEAIFNGIAKELGLKDEVSEETSIVQVQVEEKDDYYKNLEEF